jgi:FKBP-type peptidyl-prolyl cis-trans isomerase (trigger factor)
VKLVEKQKLPKIDAEFLKIFGLTEEEGVEKLKADVRKNMEREVRTVFVTKLNKLHLMHLSLQTKLKFQLLWLLKKLTVNVNK